MAKILIIAPQWMGDAVMTHSLIQLVAKKNTVDVLCVSWLEPIYQRMQNVDNVITLPLQHGKLQLKLYWQIAKKIKNQYDQCIVIPRKLKSAIIPWLAGIPKRTGYFGESRYWFINDRITADPRHTLWVQKVCALFDKKSADDNNYPNPQLTTNSSNQKKWQKELKQGGKQLVALMPGASYGVSKQWSMEHFKEVVELGKNDYSFVVLGGESERKMGDAILQGVDATGHNLSGKTSLYDAVDILSISDFCITNDSGLMHVAAATQCFVKALYGSSSPDYTPPLTNKKQIYSDTLDCKPCFKRTCSYGHYDCWKKITAERVLNNG